MVVAKVRHGLFPVLFASVRRAGGRHPEVVSSLGLAAFLAFPRRGGPIKQVQAGER